MRQGARTALWGAGGGSGMVAVEYLESSGTQWINTGIVQSDGLEIDVTFMPVGSVVRWGTFFGCGVDDSSAVNILGRIYQDSKTTFNPWFSNPTYAECQVPISTSSMNRVVLKFGSCVKDGASYTLSSVSGKLSRLNMYLFSANYNGPWRSQPCRVARYKVSSGGTTLIDLVPVRIGRKACMYDRVSDKLFENKGSGEFKAGPDVIAFKGSVAFSGEAGSELWYIPAAPLGASGNFTISLWGVASSQVTHGGFFKYGSDSNDLYPGDTRYYGGYSFGFGNTEYNNQGGNFVTLYEGVKWSSYQMQKNKTEWHHYAATRTSSTGSVRYYLDGDYWFSESLNFKNPCVSISIGGANRLNAATVARFLPCRITRFAVWSRPLEPAEVKADFNARGGTPIIQGLAHYYSLNSDGGGISLSDEIGAWNLEQGSGVTVSTSHP